MKAGPAIRTSGTIARIAGIDDGQALVGVADRGDLEREQPVDDVRHARSVPGDGSARGRVADDLRAVLAAVAQSS